MTTADRGDDLPADHIELMMRRIMAVPGIQFPSADAAIEPLSVTGQGPDGGPDGPGRGGLTERAWQRLEFLRHLWLEGRLD
jgi:hypothetical protein